MVFSCFLYALQDFQQTNNVCILRQFLKVIHNHDVSVHGKTWSLYKHLFYLYENTLNRNTSNINEKHSLKLH